MRLLDFIANGFRYEVSVNCVTQFDVTQNINWISIVHYKLKYFAQSKAIDTTILIFATVWVYQWTAQQTGTKYWNANSDCDSELRVNLIAIHIDCSSHPRRRRRLLLPEVSQSNMKIIPHEFVQFASNLIQNSECNCLPVIPTLSIDMSSVLLLAPSSTHCCSTELMIRVCTKSFAFWKDFRCACAVCLRVLKLTNYEVI